MQLLKTEPECLAAYLPDLHDGLIGRPLTELEQRGSPAIPLFRQAGGAGLLVPEKHR